MPSKKKKYNARFPSGRIKKIMQTDEEVGKVAQAVPVIISRTLELFVNSLLTKAMEITSARNAKTLTPSHMKQCILSESRFDFLKDLVKSLPESSGADADEAVTPPGNFSVQSNNLSVATESRRHSDCSNRIATSQPTEALQSRPSTYGNGTNPNFYTENVEASASFRSPGESKTYSHRSPAKAQTASRANDESSDEDDEDDLDDSPVLVRTTTSVPIPTSVEVDEDYDT